jgi:hypothetical protein
MRARPRRARPREAGPPAGRPLTLGRTAAAAFMFPPVLFAALFDPAVSAELSSPFAFALHSGAVALTLLGVYALARRVANACVAAAAILCVALHPAFLSQATEPSPAAAAALLPTALAAWGLFFYFPRPSGPVEITGGGAERAAAAGSKVVGHQARVTLSVALLLAALLLPGLRASGVWPPGGAGDEAGRPAAVNYFAAVWAHLKHFTVTGGLWALTLSGLAAMLLPPRRDAGVERPRIAVPVQLTFAALAAVSAALPPLFGATSVRGLLPALPPVMLVWVSTLWRRVPLWPLVLALVCAVFVFHFG